MLHLSLSIPRKEMGGRPRGGTPRVKGYPMKRITLGAGIAKSWGDQGLRARFILVLREFIWNALAVSLVHPAFDDTGFLGSPPCQVVPP